jgi:hypothetical protein
VALPHVPGEEGTGTVAIRHHAMAAELLEPPHASAPATPQISRVMRSSSSAALTMRVEP